MLKNFALWLIARGERDFRVSLDYARDLYRISPRAFWKMGRARAFGTHRERAPTKAVLAAHLAAALHDDCGSCVQIVVNMGLKRGISAGEIKAMMAGKLEGLAAPLSLGFRFGNAIVTNSAALETIRHEVIAAWGEKGMVDIACAVAFARTYPAMKRAMGHAITCDLVKVEADMPLARAA